MSFLKFLLGEKKSSASVAKERLQLIITHEREEGSTGAPDFLPQLQKDLIEVISKYIKINEQDLKVNVDKHGNLEVLEVKIEMPQDPKNAVAKAG
ncbi:cell division topological specificity factor MinE [Advenella kashmirensis W13003]|uniref:Cell division topological specificity factor n=1 Tax=Advenella kashmirensis W13003 TaxID=1424334 RepID=V8QPR2_9BURK|nr:cell division topological specificity factor MinE [Advenella kashmirensis]ETF01310.1 cell division topological specificity factor MinE [Advenella kashmirensis W13003]